MEVSESRMERVKSNNRQSQSPIQLSFSFVYFVFDPIEVIFSLSHSFFFSPNGFDLGRVECIQICKPCPQIFRFVHTDTPKFPTQAD